MLHSPANEEPLTAEQKRALLKALLQRSAAEPRVFPISLEQRRLFTLHQLDPAASAYNLLSTYRIAGRLDVAALRRSVAEIVRRHEVLRSVFELRDGEPVQVVKAADELVWSEIDLRALPEPDRLPRAHAIAVRATHRPFDLGAGPLVRCSLLRLGDDVQVLLLVVHHIVTDVWSFKVFNDELEALYGAYGRGEAPSLPPLAEQFGDFAAWQQAQFPEEALAGELDYWKGALRGMEVTELAGDFPRPPEQTHNGAVHAFRLPPTFLAGIERVARDNDVSPFMASLAVFQVLLHRTTGNTDVSCGIPVSNRGKLEAEALIGFFVNTVVLRTDMTGDPSFETVLARMKEAARGAYAFSHLPFDRLVQELRPHRDASRNPLFQITFQMGLFPALKLGSLDVSPLFEQDYGIVRADLELYLGEDGRAILVYNRDLYLPATIAELARRFLLLGEGVLARPAQRIGELPVMSAAERHRIVVEWNDTAAAGLPERSIHELFESQAAERPGAVAVVLASTALSYGELNRRANRLARHLRARGVGPEVPVGIHMERSCEMLVALFAILKAGGAYLPIALHQPAERVRAILDDSGTALVLADGPRPELAAALDGRTLVDLPRLDLAAYADTDLAPRATARNLAYIIYTSGSTGRPKGVLIEHRSPLNLARGMERLCYRDRAGATMRLSGDPTMRLSGDPTMRLSLNAPLEFDASMQQIVMLTRGHCLVIVPEETRLDGPAFVRYLAAHRVEGLDCTPSHLALLLDAGLLDGADRSLRKILAAGGTIDRPMWNRLAAARGVDAYDIYGPTEATVNAIGHPITEPDVTPRIGSPLEGYAVHLLDPGLRPVPRGVSGEIFLGGVGVGRGYLGRADLTAGAFVPDPYGAPGERLYRTGDFARRLEDDTLEFLGRRDEQVKLRGLRIELGEIHAHLVAHAAVSKAAVVGHGEGADQVLVAYVVPQGPSGHLAETLRADLERTCPDYMIPSRFVLLDDLPLTPSGKLDRAALPRPQLAEAASGMARSTLEESLLDVWATTFGVRRSAVGIDSNFFALGGHSLLATQIAYRLRDVFEIDLQPRLVLSHPTPREFANVVAGLRRAHAAPLPKLERVALAEPPPLSFAQERIWFLDQLEPGLTAYNIPVFLRLSGVLDEGAFAASFGHLVERHAALRTSFAVYEGKPVQRIAPAGGFSLPRVDLSALSSGRREAEMCLLAVEEGAQPFRFDASPLFRIALLQLGRTDRVLLLCMQHIITDAWSIRLLMKELSALYAGLVEGAPRALPAPSFTYADYTLWQRRILEAGSMAGELAFWRGQLAAEPAVLNLPTDRPRSSAFRYRGRNVFFGVAERELREILGAAVANGLTVFMFLTAAVQAALARFSGEQDIWIGSPMANRNQSELEGLVGLFINMVVLRGDLDRRQTVRDLLRETRRVVLDAADNQDLPFEKVVEALNPDRSLSHSPLFQCMFTFLSHPELLLDLQGVTAAPLQIDNGSAKLDLTFDLSHTGERLEGRIEYNTDLFDSTTALRLAGGFRALLFQMATRPESALGALSALSEAEHGQLVREWNDTDLERGDDPCIHQLFERQAAADPDRVAVVCGGAALSYGELDRRSNQVAHFLLAACRAERAMVGIFLRRTVDMLAALLGILKAGKTYVPLDPAYPQDRILRILAASRAELVLTDRALGERLASAPCASVLVDAGAFARFPGRAPRPQASPDDLAYVIFTSGSTGNPKGVVLQHRPVANLIEWVNRTFAVGAGDVVLFITSLCFDLSVYDVFGALAAGATVLLADDDEIKDPERLVEILYERPVTFWDSAPAALSQLQPFFDARRGRDAALRLVFLSGDWIPLGLPPAVAETFPRARVIGLGGATEAAIWSNFFPIGAIDRDWKSIPYGRPIQNARYFVLDPDLAPCPINIAGDLYIGGGCLSLGYLGEPVLTARQYVPDPFSPEPGAVLYSTGDRARFRRDGNIEFLGRVDSQVKVRGFRIELGEIESVLESAERVQKAVVLARSDRPGEKRLVAYVQPRPEAGAPAAPGEEESRADLLHDLLQWLRSKLPEYMVPSALLFVEQWPVTANGKLDRKALPAPDAGGVRDAFVSAQNAAQEALATIWAEVLGLAEIGIHDNFFALGGDSILAIQIVARANQVGLRIRARDFFQTQTVATMLPRALEGEAEVEEQGAAVLEAALTPVQKYFFALRLVDPNHFNQAVLLEWKGALDVARLLAALDRLCAQHDALRLRFIPADSGWRQEARPRGGERAFAFHHLDLERVACAGAAVLEECATAVQGSLDIVHGPLFAAALLATGPSAPQRILLVAHHLAIDGVSWRILLDDLAAFYARPLAAPPVHGKSWMDWAGGLDHPGLADSFRGEEAFWLRQGRAGDLACDFPAGKNLAGSAATLVGRLSREETELLERRVPDVYRTSTVDVLLAAFLRAVGEGAERLSVTVDLESHGRSHELGGGDLSRTVGWFTSIYPLRIEVERVEVDRAAGEGALLKSVKEQLRAVPREGAGYGVLRYLGGQESPLADLPRPPIIFNYLGRFDQALVDNDLFRLRTDGTGEDIGWENERPHLLEVNSLVFDGVLETRWRFSRSLHRAATIERYLERFLVELRALIGHCLSPGAGGRTPSDFPLAGLSQAALDALLAEHPALTDLYPATAMQQGMLFHGELEPGSYVYRQQVALDIRGSLDLAAFEAAWSAAIARHSCLRTLFVIAEGRYLQAVVADHPSFWRVEDWRGLAGPARRDRLASFAEEDLGRPFAPSQEPPFRVAVVRLDADTHHLLVTFHHAIMDGWSLAILLEEVSELYQAALGGRPPELLPARPYRDYAEWLESRDAEQTRSFWRRYLAGFGKPNQLVRSGLLKRVDRGNRAQRIVLPRDLIARLETCARRHLVTQSTIVQAAWTLLVGRYGNADDVVVGVTTSGREQGLQGIERMLGLFINTLPLRVPLDEPAAVGAWLQGVQRNVLGVRELDHSSLVEVQAASELGSGQQLFESIVVVENYPFSEALMRRWLGQTIENVRAHERANYPLSLLVELRSDVTLEVNYEARFFDDAWVGRALGHLRALLAGITGDEASSLAALEMLSEGERHQLAVEANDSADGWAGAGSLPAWVGRQAALTPDRLAVVSHGDHLSFGGLVERSAGLAGTLRREGVRSGDRVGLWMERSVEAIVAVFGILRAGAAYVPVDVEYPVDRLEFMLADSGARWVLTKGPELAARLSEVCPDADVIDLETADPSPADPAASLGEVDPAQPAYVIYTSGSTGKPKGVVVEHRSVLNLLNSMHRLVYPDDGAGGWRLSVNAPFAFDASMQQMMMLCRGHSLCVVPAEVRKDGGAFLGFLVEEQLDGLDITPTHLGILLEAGLLARPDLALRRVVVAGGYIDQAMWNRLADSPRTRFFDIYGPTEATVNATGRAIDQRDVTPSIGRPLANYRVHVLDKGMRLAPRGVPGQLLIGGRGLAQGYHARPDLTAARFAPDPLAGEPGARLYQTGDLARVLEDGELEFLGRMDHQVKIRGFRVELEEIESVLLGHEGISGAVVVLEQHAAAEAMLLAFYTTRNGRDREREELRGFARRILPEYMVPNDFVRLERMPLLASGKVARDKLPRIGATLRRQRMHPRNPMEERLAEIWSAVLGVEKDEVGVANDFLSLGGHSLNAVLLLSRMQRELGVDLSLKSLYEGSTIGDIAAAATGREAELLQSERAEELLGELQNLSDEEIRALLEQAREESKSSA